MDWISDMMDNGSKRLMRCLAPCVVLLIAAGLHLWAVAPAGSEMMTLEVGQPEFYPLSYTGESGEAEGLLIDIMKKVAPEAGYKFNTTFYPGKRLFANLERGQVHVWMGIAQYAPKDTTLVGKTPIAHIELRVYHLDGPPVDKKEALNGKRVAILRGYSYGSWRDYIMDPSNRIVYFETDSRDSAIKMLNSRRVDYYIDYKRPSIKALEATPARGIGHRVIASFDCFFVVSGNVPVPEKVLERLEGAYKRLVERGAIDPDR